VYINTKIKDSLEDIVMGNVIAVENIKNVFFSFFNLIWKKENFFATLLTVLMVSLLIGEIHDKFPQPVNMDYVSTGIMMTVVLILIAFFIAAEIETPTATMIAVMVASVFSSSVSAVLASTFARTTGIIQVLWSIIIFLIIFFLTDRLWIKGRRYFPAYILFCAAILVAIQ